MAYSSITKPSDFFNTKLYTGNGNAGHAQTGIGHQPDFVWLKSRTNGEYHNLYDSIRGVTKRLVSNQDTLESSISGLTAFGTDGFTVGAADTANQNSQNFVAWNWKAGTTGSGTTGGSGTGKAYSYSVNTTSGFSIVKYVGNGTAGHTIPHHLGAAPKMVICKSMSENRGWPIQHASLTSAAYSVFLSTTGAQSNGSNSWNSTAASSSVVTLADNASNNKDGDSYIMYSFAEKQGYSKFGNYLGNGNTDGTFVNLGFKPAFVMVKQTNASGEDWFICDNRREGYNAENNRLLPNLSSAESTDSPIDLLSNGFKARTSGANVNGSGATYIYMAFAEEPFVASNYNVATAR